MRMPDTNHPARNAAIITCIFLVLTVQTSGYSQNVISIRSGLITYCVGGVYLNEQRVHLSSNQNQEVSDGMTLYTDTGLAEIQLGAGAFLYVNENTRLTMLDSRLESTVLHLRHGSVMIEIFEEMKDNNFSARYENAVIEFKKKGLYRLDADREQLRVNNGQAVIRHPEGTLKVKSNRDADLGTYTTVKFDDEENDRFRQWTMARAFRHFQRLRTMQAENFRNQTMTRSYESIMQEQALRSFHEMNQQELERQRQKELQDEIIRMHK